MIKALKNKWQQNAEYYRQQEVGSGVHSFVKDIFLAPELFDLVETPKRTNKFDTFTHDAEKKKEGRPDFVLYMSEDVAIPVEVKCYGRIIEGINQLRRYQLDYSKQYGILTDGYEWRFYRSATYRKFTIDEIFEKPTQFIIFWRDYIKSESYYLGIFNPAEKSLFEEKLDLNDPENRKVFFEDTTKLIENFRTKMQTLGIWGEAKNVQENKNVIETTYTFLIQFILFKVIVDTGPKNYIEWYKNLFKIINKYLHEPEHYQSILINIKSIADFISSHIYKPFKEEQEAINNKIFTNFKSEYSIDDISAWLDIIIFIDKYRFDNLRNEIFGFIYENYLKDLYHNENKGQYFTDPAVVNYMLDIADFNPEKIGKNQDKLSIIDPSCGAGTFLYSAVDRIITAFVPITNPKTDNEKKQLKQTAEYVEKTVRDNIFGLDIEEFPLYLAEMNILMRLLPLIVNDSFENPIDEKLKIFKTKDSISEFLDAEIGAINPEIDYPTLFSKTDIGYQSFMRDNKNLQEMIESMQGHNGERLRFDYVFGNPPYIGYNECSKQNMEFIKRLQDKNDNSITMGNVYGINLNTVPDRRKPYSPKPNLYAFFVALSFSLLKKNGKICFIIPQTMLTAGDLDVLRYYLAKFTTIEKLVTFEGNLFIDRGLNEKKPVSTSSLIFVATKNQPAKNHQVEITNFDPYLSKEGESFKDYFSGKHKGNRKQILQTELLENLDNWNFIKSDKQNMQFAKKYAINSISIEDYRKTVLANYDEIHLDVGYILDNSNFTKTNVNTYPILDFKGSYGYTKLIFNNFYPKDESKIQLTRNSRYSTLGHKYNIVNRIKNFQKFYFTTEPVIFSMGAASVIATDNKQEALFLFSLLNSFVSYKILKSNLKLTNEKEFQVAIKSIKQYIRIPKINSENQLIKNKIIELTEKMLDFENVTLKDLVEFSGLTVQRFENIEVKGNNLLLTFNGKEYQQKINKGKTDFVKKIIIENFYDNNLIFNKQEVTLQELQNLETIDFEEQNNIKKHIDNLVFSLYFNVNIPDNQLDNFDFIQKECEKSDYYK
jgi:hypothetical protein